MKLLYLLALFPIFLSAQQLQPVTSVQPDCQKFLSPIVGAGTFVSATVDNRQAACDGWVVTYSSFGFATVSVLLEDAPLTTAGVAGTFVSYAGTIMTGFANPATATTQGEIRAAGATSTGVYFPYVRVSITTTGAGILFAEFHGFKTNPNSGTGGGGGGGSGCVGTIATPCIVAGPDAPGAPPTQSPVLVAGQDGTDVQTLLTDSLGRLKIVGAAQSGGSATGFNPVFVGTSDGVSIVRPFICTQQLLFNLSGAGNTQVIPANGAKTIKICHIDFATATAEDIKLTQGTGVDCATGTTDLTGLYKSVSAMAQDYSPSSALVATATNAVCINQTNAQALGGVVIYAQF